MTSEDPKLPILEIDNSGDPVAPKENRRKFINQAGVIVRDMLPITITDWHKPAAADVEDPCYVHSVTKDLLYDTLLSHFNLPQDLSDFKKKKLKQWTLSKMATQFRNWKKTLWKKYENEDPDFSGTSGTGSTLVKIQDNWAAFKAYKKSAAAVARSEKNKENASKKVYHHRLGTGGYRSAIPNWLACEDRLMAKGIRPQTYDWPERSKFWLFAHGASLDEETGLIVADGKFKKTVETIVPKLVKAIDEVRRGVFKPDRADDELSRALGNVEHVGRVRGQPGGTNLLSGYPECADTYRSRSRAKKKAEDRFSQLELKVQKQQELLEALSQQRASQQQIVSPQVDRSQHRSSVGSTQLQVDVDAHYPVDDITERTNCELHTPMRNISLKVAVGYVLPNESEANNLNGDIPPGYARVGVDEVVPEFQTLDLEIPGGEDEATLQDVKGGFALWNKKYIVLLGQPALNQQNSSLPEREPSARQQSPAVLPEMTPMEIESQHKQQDPVLPEMETIEIDSQDQQMPVQPEMETIEIESQDKQQSPVHLERDPSASPSRSPRREQEPVKWLPRKRPRGSPVRKKPAKEKTPPPQQKLPWENTVEENAAIVQKELKQFFAPKVKVPEPKFTANYTAEACHRTIDNLYNPPESPPSDYVRSISKSYEELEQKQVAKKVGKQIPQLGEQAAQSVPPLKVFDQEEIHRLAKAALGDPRQEASSSDDIPMLPLARQFVLGANLVDGRLSTKMRAFHNWYKETSRDGTISMMVGVKEEHFGREYAVSVEFKENFQLYNIRALDKSIISTYCL